MPTSRAGSAEIVAPVAEAAAKAEIATPKGGMQPSALSPEAQAALDDLGMGPSQRQALAADKSVAFTLSDAAEGTVAVAQLTAEGRLRIGIYTIKNIGGG